MGGRPSKTHLQLVAENNKGHRAKAELAAREKAEKALLTGTSLKEWKDVKNIPVAHREFLRIKKLLCAIGHDDALHEAVINRYCMLLAECKEFEDMKAGHIKDIVNLDIQYANVEMDFTDYIKEKGNVQDRIMTCDRKIMDKRKMMLAIERENIMTISSTLRSIPKKPREEKEEDQMANLLNRKTNGGG